MTRALIRRLVIRVDETARRTLRWLEESDETFFEQGKLHVELALDQKQLGRIDATTASWVSQDEFCDKNAAYEAAGVFVDWLWPWVLRVPSGAEDDKAAYCAGLLAWYEFGRLREQAFWYYSTAFYWLQEHRRSRQLANVPRFQR